MLDFATITLAVEDGIATLTLNRPDAMNTFNLRMVRDMIAAFDRTDADDAVRAVIVTGAGRAFCAGADLSGGTETFDYDKRRASAGPDTAPADGDRDGGGMVSLRIFASLKPVIAAVNGAAVGVGATMTLPMDIRLMSSAAKYGFVFARRGIVPEACSSWFLPRVVGISTAMEWVASGRLILPDEALDRRLVRSVHAPDDLLPAARAIAREIADNTAPVSVALARQMLWQMLGADHPMAAHRLESRLMIARGKSADTAEGIKSFLEKRPANFPLKVSADMPQPFPWAPPRRFAD